MASSLPPPPPSSNLSVLVFGYFGVFYYTNYLGDNVWIVSDVWDVINNIFSQQDEKFIRSI